MWWAGNQSITSEQFELLYADFLKHAEGMTLSRRTSMGADRASRSKPASSPNSLALAVQSERADPPRAIRAQGLRAELTIIDIPSFPRRSQTHGVRSENVVAIDFARKIVLIGGLIYAGEMKKSGIHHAQLLSARQGRDADALLANWDRRAMPRFSSACPEPERPTLSADPKRTLIGDDDTAGKDGIFQLRGRLLRPNASSCRGSEPEIYAASKRFCAVLENVVLDEIRASPISTWLERPRTPARPIRSISSQRLAHRPYRPTEERGDAGGGRLRRACRRSRN